MASKKGTEGPHSFFGESADCHVSIGSYEGGSCLNGHMSQWKENDSCSYRWQGLKQAEDHPGPYNSHPGPKNSRPSTAYHLGGSGIGNPAVSSIEKRLSGEVIDLLGVPKLFTKILKSGKNAGKLKETMRQLVRARNFTNGFAPYSNQVHHVLPNAVLSEGIVEITDSNADLVKDICDGLMQEMYNINFHINMLILPTENRDSVETGLPTHCGSHPTYSNAVKAGVKAALRAYAGVAAQGEKHPPADYQALKDELEAISNSTYAEVVAWGQAKLKNQTPQAVNNVPSSVVTFFG